MDEVRIERIMLPPAQQPPVQVNQVPLLIQAACGLDLNQAKSITYYAVATHGLTHLRLFPALFLQGAPATGKSTILDILELLTYQPKRLDGSLSKAEFRDSLNDSPTVLIEEADQVNERQIRNRYSRSTSKMSVKRERRQGWESEPLDTFGATVLHRRDPFKDPAVQSRAITVRTRKADGPFNADLNEIGQHHELLVRLATEITWDLISTHGGSRIRDSWAPLQVVACHIQDEEWAAWAETQIVQADATLNAGQEEEPPQLVFSAIMHLALVNGGDTHMQPDERVTVSDIAKELSDRAGKYNSWQIGDIVRNLGFEVRKAGGTQYVYIGGAQKLLAIGAELGIEDEWLAKAAERLQAG